MHSLLLDMSVRAFQRLGSSICGDKLTEKVAQSLALPVADQWIGEPYAADLCDEVEPAFGSKANCIPISILLHYPSVHRA